MQSYLIPKSISTNIVKILNVYIGDNEGGNKVHIIIWNVLPPPKLEGGLDFKKMQSMNKAFLTKSRWGIYYTR